MNWLISRESLSLGLSMRPNEQTALSRDCPSLLFGYFPLHLLNYQVISPQLVVPGSSEFTFSKLLFSWEKSESFLSVTTSKSPRMNIDYLWLGYKPIPEPITVTTGNSCSDWQRQVSHPTLEHRLGPLPPTTGEAWRLDWTSPENQGQNQREEESMQSTCRALQSSKYTIPHRHLWIRESRDSGPIL